MMTGFAMQIAALSARPSTTALCARSVYGLALNLRRQPHERARTDDAGGPADRHQTLLLLGVRLVYHLRLQVRRQEQWEDWGADAWTGEQIEAHPKAKLDEFEPPKRPPADWEADEDDPAWKFCEREHPAAVKVYVCEPRA